MALIAAVVGGLALAAVGTHQTIKATKSAEKAQLAQIAAQRRAEQLRQRQMELDAQRKRREALRNMLIARSTALANITAAGAGQGSALPGATAGIMGQFGRQIQAVNQNQIIGAGMFEANMDSFTAQAANARAQGQAGVGQALVSLGGSIVQNVGAIDRVGTTLFSGSSAPTTGWEPTVIRS